MAESWDEIIGKHVRWVARTTACAIASAAAVSLIPSVSQASVRLHRVSPPGRTYSVELPTGWRYRDVSYPSDHATQLWWTPSDPLARLIVVLSGCIGCVSTNDYTTPNPAGAAAGAVSTYRISPDVLAFTGGFAEDEADYEDNGLVIVTTQNGRIDGYIRADLWLPPGERTLATAILNSFHLG